MPQQPPTSAMLSPILFGMIACAPCDRAHAAILDLGTFNDHQYYYDTEDYTAYADASVAAASLVNGRLVSITSGDENAFLVSAIGPFSSSYQRLAWIGLERNTDASPFTWTSGEPVGYTNWRPAGIADPYAEPTNGTFAPGETRGMMYVNFAPVPLGYWADHYPTNAEPLNAIYEKVIPEPAATSALTVGASIILLRRRRRANVA